MSEQQPLNVAVHVSIAADVEPMDRESVVKTMFGLGGAVVLPGVTVTVSCFPDTEEDDG